MRKYKAGDKVKIIWPLPNRRSPGFTEWANRNKDRVFTIKYFGADRSWLFLREKLFYRHRIENLKHIGPQIEVDIKTGEIL